MRIAYLTQSYPPVISGAAVVVQGLAEAMAARGHQVLVIATSDRDRPYDVYKKGMTIKRLGSLPNPFRTHHRFSICSHAPLMAALKDFSPEVIHSHDPFQFLLSALAYGEKNNSAVTLTLHQLPWFVGAYLPAGRALQVGVENALWAYGRRIAGRVDQCIAPTRVVAERVFERTGILPKVIGYGLDQAYWNSAGLSPELEAGWRTRLGIPAGAPVILHVGRLDLDKKVDVVIRAVAGVIRDQAAHLVIVGDGTERSRLAQLCFQLGIGERCHFAGFVRPDQGLAALYRMSALFISASEIETQGLVFYEAAACGLPIAAVDATCISEIVRHGINGLLAKPGDLDGLTSSVKYLLSDVSRAASMGLAGVKISQMFTLQHTLDEHECLYLRLKAARVPFDFSPITSGQGRVRHSAGSG